MRFLKVQNEWVVFKTIVFFRKRNKKRSFNERLQKRLTTLDIRTLIRSFN